MGITEIFRGFHALQRKQIWENINLRPRVSNDNIHIWLEMMRVLSLATQHVLNILFFISPILHDIKSLYKKAAEIRWNWVIIVIYISKHKKHFTIIFFKMQSFHLDKCNIKQYLITFHLRIEILVIRSCYIIWYE